MASTSDARTSDPELDAMRDVYTALKDLDAAAQNRVLDYVFKRLSIKRSDYDQERIGSSFSPRELTEEVRGAPEKVVETTSVPEPEEGLEGVSPVALKWIKRNNLEVAKLSRLFTLGLDEIDLVAKSLPGKSKRQKMKNVMLLACVAGYLGTGAPRAAYNSIKEALNHYDAYDVTNFAAYIRDLAPEVSGSKEAGYTLTARGLATAAELITAMTSSK